MLIIDTTRYPHVHPTQQRIIRTYEGQLNNTGGNDPVDLLNDIQDPGTDESPNRIASTNIVRFTLGMAILAQVTLLHALINEGALPELDEYQEG